jgi:polysaccharide chain length determinant protein (PEP-CTERM system associated)
MLPGKTYTPEDVLDILRRRIWVLLLPLALISAATAVVVRMMPDRYRAETLVLVVPQRVPAEYVRPTVTARIEDRLQSIRQQILSRTRLERIIQEFNLYEEERKTMIMEDIVARMRNEVVIDVVRGDAFRVAYSGSDPRTVMRVTDRLADLFKEENLRDREILAEGTNQFLETQLADARQRLIENEKKLETYRKVHAGELPTQLESNLAGMQNIQAQIGQLIDGMNRDRDRRLVVERQLADARTEAARPVVTAAADPGDMSGSATQQLASARLQLQQLEMRLKPDHPDVGILKRRIRDLEKRAEQEALDTPVSDTTVRPVSPAAKLAAELAAEIQQLDRQIAFKQGEEKRLRALAVDYERRIQMAPARESELVELTRDYTTIQQFYASLMSKNEEAKIAANLERRQIGEQFKILDPARMPERPFSPNRTRMTLFGLVGGLALGLALVLLLEYRDRTFRFDDEVARVLSLPVLAVVPIMLADADRRSQRNRRLAMSLGFGSTVIACLAVVVYTLVR